MAVPTNMLRAFNRVAQVPQVRAMVTRTLPKAGGGGGYGDDGHHDDHPHLVFDNKSTAFKVGATIIIWGGVVLGMYLPWHAVRSAQRKAGVWKIDD